MTHQNDDGKTEEFNDAEPLLMMTHQNDDRQLETQEDELLLMTRQNDDSHSLKSDRDISIGGLRCREQMETPWNPLQWQCDSDTESTSASVEEESSDAEADLTLRAFQPAEHAKMPKPASENFHRRRMGHQHS